MNSNQPNTWIGVDLDGTLAEYDEWVSIDHIGKPIQPMLDRVKSWLQEGKEVRLFTARWDDTPENQRAFLVAWRDWCFANNIPTLRITTIKDSMMIELWDDRCIQVEKNTGIPLAKNHRDMLIETCQTLWMNSGDGCLSGSTLAWLVKQPEYQTLVDVYKNDSDINYYYLDINEQGHLTISYNRSTSEYPAFKTAQVFTSLEECQQIIDRTKGVPSPTIMCSSSLDFPYEYTEDQNVIDMCDAIRNPSGSHARDYFTPRFTA
tara:strand:+ start:262 stop:1047 length:786 start_codon:yes stop_codon:yes gene_type:complete